jgi:hypothetical protein
MRGGAGRACVGQRSRPDRTLGMRSSAKASPPLGFRAWLSRSFGDGSLAFLRSAVRTHFEGYSE